MKRRDFINSGLALGLPTLLSPVYATPATPIIGISLPKTGVQAAVGAELEAGYQLAIKASGSNMRLLVMDDGGVVDRVVQNVQQLSKNVDAIAVSGIVGTPHAQAALPIAKAAGLPVIGIRSGSVTLRSGSSNVIHLRSSYDEELDSLAKMCAGFGLTHVSIIYSNDSFGEETKAYLSKQLEKKNINLNPAIPVARDGSDISQASEKCATFIKAASNNTGIVLLMIAKPMIETARELRLKHTLVAPLFAMSFTASKTVASEAVPSLSGLGITSAFPLPRSSNTGPSQMFRNECLAHGAADLISSLTAYEGWFYAKAIIGTNAQSRTQVLQNLSAGITIAGQKIKPDSNMVAYKFTEIVYKSADGRLRA
jgi:branched-chain amino acid transport system substrate-binding protein